MAGEMSWIKQDGTDSDGNVWETHAAIAKAVGGYLRPFDQYQGPYITVGGDVVVGIPPYGVPAQHLGVVRLWLCNDEDGLCYIYREDIDKSSFAFFCGNTDAAIAEARALLGREE